ncbi:MAG TPA: hypothetical protein VHW69_10635 [Rhizomicrobium sp.]|jgi:DNA processing protein|nr:hypothetical protein [Rhizomicrobium sp.]
MLGNAFREPETSAVIPSEPNLESGISETENLQRTVLELLGPSPIAVDDLVRQCGVPTAVVLTVLLELELAGRAQRQPGNRVSRA